MGYFQVRYNSRVVIYDHSGFKRLATGLRFLGLNQVLKQYVLCLPVESSNVMNKARGRRGWYNIFLKRFPNSVTTPR